MSDGDHTCVFYFFALMPSRSCPLLASFVYGNYQLYKLREWSPFTLNIGIMCIIIGVIVYVRNRRHKHRLRKDHKEHIKKFRNSVVLELSSVQLQSKPGQPIKRGSVAGERRRLSVFAEEPEEDEGGERGFVSSPIKASTSPLHSKGRRGGGQGGEGGQEEEGWFRERTAGEPRTQLRGEGGCRGINSYHRVGERAHLHTLE